MNAAKIHLTTIILLSLCLTCCIREVGQGNGVENYVEVGDMVPAFEASGPSGEFSSPEDFMGKRSLVFLFTTGCGDCRRELQKIQEVWEALGEDDGYRIATFARGQTAAEVAEYWEDTERWKDKVYTMPYYPDTDRAIFNLFANSYVPRLYILDQSGKITFMAIETFDFDAGYIIDKMNE